MQEGKSPLLLAIVLMSCTAQVDTQFSLPPTLDRRAQITGYVSTDQERLGVYPRSNWKLKDNEVCYFADPQDIDRFRWSHGEMVKISARITESLCGKKSTVCFQRCSKYVLRDIESTN